MYKSLPYNKNLITVKLGVKKGHLFTKSLKQPKETA